MGNDVKDLKLRTFNLNLNKLKLNFKIYYFNSNGKIDETHENVEIEFKNPPKKDLIMAKCKDCVNRYSCPILSSILKDDPKLIYELEEYKFK
jgi:hypothetical protein